MKKIAILSLGIVMTALLVGCGSSSIPQTTSIDTGNVLPSTSGTMCANAIHDYLNKADMTGKDGKAVAKGHTVTVHYIGRLNEETVFDTSVEEIAKACGLYRSGKNYNEGLTFNVGAGQMIAGFDKGVEGMKIGQTKTIHIEASEAYGERSKDNLIKVPREQIPDADKLQKGMQLVASNGRPFTVYEVGKKEITLDGNSELAGKNLIFDITVTDIQE